MTNAKKSNYYDAKKTYLGFVETVNPDAGYYERQIENKIVILTKTSENTLVPIYPDYEYHNLLQSQPVVSFLPPKDTGFFGYINEKQLRNAIARTGLKEANRLNRPEDKILKKVS